MLHLNAPVFQLKCSVSSNKVTKLIDNGHPREAVFSHSKGHLRGFKANKNVQVVCIKVNMVLLYSKNEPLYGCIRLNLISSLRR